MIERQVIQFVHDHRREWARAAGRSDNASSFLTGVEGDLSTNMISAATNPLEARETSQSSYPILSFQEVTKEYKTDGEPVQALNRVSLQVERGKFVALVGRSGCGKSTLLNLAGAMDFPTRGRVLLDNSSTTDFDETGLTKLRREKVGFVFQSFQLLHTLSSVENVELPLLLAGHSNSRAKAMEWLDFVGMADLARRMPHQLSGGQMQRVAIARALVHSPRILLADEPTGNLDTATGISILELLRWICKEQKTTILMATHSIESQSFVHSVVRMRDGQIEEIIES
jgi:ABC-type lipoprotein export system ATPase subunit